MKLLIGLGNPGSKYQMNRHNIGFMVIDALFYHFDFPNYRNQCNGQVSKQQLFSQTTLICKPQTFMNLSGRSVACIAKFYKIPCSDWLVIQDDIDMEFGTTKLRLKGGAGGHNGIRSIIESTGETDFARLKIGIGRPFGSTNPSDHVLSNFSAEQIDSLKEDVFEEVLSKIEIWLGTEVK